MASIQHQYLSHEVKLPSLIKKIFSKKETTNEYWVHEIKGAIFYDELTLQKVITRKIIEELPSYHVIYYNKSIQSTADPTKKNKPDFLLWKKDYSEWYIIEVELNNHSVTHIVEQVSTFYHGDYSNYNDITEYVKRLEKTTDIIKFSNLIQSKRPKLMVISDHIKCEWEIALSKFDCLLATLQVYCDEKNNMTYRFSGEWPQEYREYTFCTVDKLISLLEIPNSFFKNFGFNDQDKITIFYRGIGENWQLIVDEQTGGESLLFLGPSLTIDLTQKRWNLIRDNKKTFHLKKI